jgi:hypothetical protein
VLDRKNFVVSREAKRRRTAILCSLVQTSKHLQINPFVYLGDVERLDAFGGAGLGTDTPPVETFEAGLGRQCPRLNEIAPRVRACSRAERGLGKDHGRYCWLTRKWHLCSGKMPSCRNPGRQGRVASPRLQPFS